MQENPHSARTDLIRRSQFFPLIGIDGSALLQRVVNCSFLFFHVLFFLHHWHTLRIHVTGICISISLIFMVRLVGNFFPDPVDPSFHSVRKKLNIWPPEFYSVTIFLPCLPSQKLTEPLNNGGWETTFLWETLLSCAMLVSVRVSGVVATQIFIVYCHPENWGRWTHFESYIFQMGWNHQLV